MWRIAALAVLIFGAECMHYKIPYTKTADIVFDRILDQCPEYKGPVEARVTNVTTYYLPGSNKMAFNYNLNIYKDTPSNFEIVAEIQKCSVKEAPDSCRNLRGLKTKNVCNLVNNPSPIWASTLSCLSPTLICPLKKGVYQGRNCSINMEAFNWFPLGKEYLIAKIKFIGKSPKFNGCALLGLQTMQKNY